MTLAIKNEATGHISHINKVITSEMVSYLKANPCSSLVKKTKNGWKCVDKDGLLK